MHASALLAAVITLVGVLLLVYMITVEGEMGAIPLLLIAGGIGAFLLARRRTRSSSVGNPPRGN